MINKGRSLGVFTANATGAGVDISDLGEKDIAIWASSGTFNASVQVQVSFLGGASTPASGDASWMSLGSAIAAVGSAHSLVRARWMRAVVSAISGTQTIQVVVFGDYSHEAGGARH